MLLTLQDESVFQDGTGGAQLEGSQHSNRSILILIHSTKDDRVTKDSTVEQHHDVVVVNLVCLPDEGFSSE